MSEKKLVTMDGNAAVSHVAQATNEVIAIYPITPSSSMGELSDQFSAEGRPNIWGTVPDVIEMQSEAGASAACHGALTTGALTTTFTASQGLLLMIPTMFKLAGELTPTVFHISARSVACQALSIFGDHSDVMATRGTGFGMLASNSVQEAMDMALISQAASLESQLPFLHFFDGFRTSSEVQKIEQLDYEAMRSMIDPESVALHRRRGLTPENPSIRGTSQNPDIYFTARETVNRYYDAAPDVVERVMDRFAEMTGRAYKPFDYVGAPDAERVVILMGSGAETAHEAVDYLTARGEKVGVLKVRLYRPFSADRFLAALPDTVKRIAVLDRTKEPGSIGEPLHEDIHSVFAEQADQSSRPLVVGGRYGLSSREFTPGMVRAVFDNLASQEPKNHFTIGIEDDVTHTSLPWSEDLDTGAEGVRTAVFYGLGSDGTVGASRNSVKIIGEATENYAQGYFVYDSKKAGATTVSHLRFGPNPIRSTYLISKADFLACHKFSFVERYDMLKNAKEGATFLLNSPYPADQVWDNLPQEVQKQIIDKKLGFYVIDGYDIAEKAGMPNRINIAMQTAFFKISGILPEDQAIELIRTSIKDTYGKKGQEIVDRNMKSVDLALDGIQKVDYPQQVTSKLHMVDVVPKEAPEFVRQTLGPIMAGRGEDVSVSKLPDDGTYPVGTTKYEKRNIAEYIPVWDPEVCIQCGDCAFVCPHGTIRMKIFDEKHLEGAPAGFQAVEATGRKFKGNMFTLQVAPEDCTGCATCVVACPAFKKENGQKTDYKAINMQPQPPLREQQAKNWEFFESLPETDPSLINPRTVKGTQLLPSMFEFSGACAGCGETPYVRLMTQLFGDRMIIGNATGCSSIYGGNLPTTPYTTRNDGRGPSWSNSLFEDTGEFSFGMRLKADAQFRHACTLLDRAVTELPDVVDAELASELKNNPQKEPAEIEQQREKVADLKKKLEKKKGPLAEEFLTVADGLIRQSIWGLGGDGWAYDIGFGGLDHVMAMGRDVNLLCLDTEVYSNTGGQMSKGTPLGAIAKFAFGGKGTGKKDLGLMMMSYGYVYVAQIAMGASRAQTIKAFLEAESYDGPSLIIAYSHCIAHGIQMEKGLDLQKTAVESGVWPLYRYDPRLAEQGKNPFQLDSKEPTEDVASYMNSQIRFRSLKRFRPEAAERFIEQTRHDVQEKYSFYRYLADRPGSGNRIETGDHSKA